MMSKKEEKRKGRELLKIFQKNGISHIEIWRPILSELSIMFDGRI